MTQATWIRWLDQIPLWGMFVLSLGFALAAMELGHRVGRWRCQRDNREKETPVGATVGSTLALLAFMLAFTFGLAATRFDNRRETYLAEVNAIRTAFLRADFLPGDHAALVRRLLRDYVATRLEIAQPGADVPGLLRQAEALHTQLWSEASAAGRESPSSETVAMGIESLNEVIELHSQRVMASLQARIPPVIWGALYLVAGLSLVSMGYQVGLANSSRPTTGFLMILAFVVILMLICDLDRPQDGLINISQEAMRELQKSMAHDG